MSDLQERLRRNGIPGDDRWEAADALDQKQITIDGLMETCMKKDDYIARLENQRKFDNDMLKEKDAEIVRLRDALKDRWGHIVHEQMARIEKLEACRDALGEYLYDSSKRQQAQDAYIAAAQEERQPCPDHCLCDDCVDPRTGERYAQEGD